MRLVDWLREGVGGPGGFRFVLQPAIAALLAIRDGYRDAKAGEDPFFAHLFHHREDRKALIKSAWSTLALPLIIAFAIDSVLQLVIMKSYRPRSSLGVAILLVGLPYSLLRGIACRLARTRLHLPRHRHP